MPSKNFNQFTAVTSVGDTDVIPLWVGGANKKITGANLKTSMHPATNTFSQVCYVSANGNNSTAVIGDSDFPFLTMQAAYAAAGSANGPKVFYLSAGTFSGLTDDISGVNIRVLGAGKDKTYITLVAATLDGENGPITIQDIGYQSCTFTTIGAKVTDTVGPTITLFGVRAGSVLASGGDSVGVTAQVGGAVTMTDCYIEGTVTLEGGHTPSGQCGNGGTFSASNTFLGDVVSLKGGSVFGGTPGDGGNVTLLLNCTLNEDLSVAGGGGGAIDGGVNLFSCPFISSITYSTTGGSLTSYLSYVTSLNYAVAPTITAHLSRINSVTY